MALDSDSFEHEVEESGSGQNETHKESNMSSIGTNTGNEYSQSPSPPMLTPIKESETIRSVNNQVSLVPNLTFNFNQFIGNIPNFSGENPDITVGDFIDKILEIKDFAGWQEAQCVFAIKLKCIGEAQKFLKSQPHLKKTQSFLILREALTNRFSKTVDEACHLHEFTMARQFPRETNRAFLSRILGLSYKCFADQETIREKLLVQKCLQGLQPEVRKFIMPHSPTTYQQIWDLAICHEKCAEYDDTQMTVNVAQAGSSSSNELQEIKNLIQTVVSENDRKIAELSNQVQTLLQITQSQGHNSQNTNTGPSQRHFRPRRPITCYRCNQQGHLKRNCTTVLTQNTNEGSLN